MAHCQPWPHTLSWHCLEKGLVKTSVTVNLEDHLRGGRLPPTARRDVLSPPEPRPHAGASGFAKDSAVPASVFNSATEFVASQP